MAAFAGISTCVLFLAMALLLDLQQLSHNIVQMSHGKPIQPPDLNKCERAFASSVTGPPVNQTYNCCLPLPKKKVVKFSLKRAKAEKVKRVRRAAHLADAEYIKKYNKAYELMKALPADDPRSFSQQADVHCAFCNGAYKQGGTKNVTLQIHFSWIFLPWHRWFLYFHERILAKLVGDPEFSLLYWNWDNQVDGYTVPAFFNKNNTAVYDAIRDQSHMPPYIIHLTFSSNSTNLTQIINDNLNHMYKSVVTPCTAQLFEGGAYRMGTDLSNSTVISAPLGGSIENDIHNTIHHLMGDPRQPLLQDMGVFSTAGRDPIFYAHHSNIDRLWEVWKYDMPGGPRFDHNDSDFLNAEFIFYDENADLVKVKVKDALDSKNLGVTYTKAETDQLWINFSPNVTTTIPPFIELPTIGPATSDSVAFSLGKRFSAWVTQPRIKQGENLEVLTIQGVELNRTHFTQVLVFINLPDADENTNTDTAEYVGTFSIIPTESKHKHLMTNPMFEIGDNIKRIGLEDQEQVIITLVVKSYKHHKVDVTIRGMELKYSKHE